MNRLFTRSLIVLALALVPTIGHAEFSKEDSYAGSEDGVEAAFNDAAKLIEEHSYRDAIAKLESLLETRPDYADALNLMGFSYRKLGDYDNAFKYYKLALENNPLHRGANEYMGEAYLEKGDLASAEKNMETLKRACPLGCPEIDKLQKAMDDFTAKGRQG
ncbi:MAG: tetratricopeptide repeat protein [Proteobacteria bacterium]|nr:tetratricopeptide repeat protein [Pseudomonadota bacterium]